MDGADEVDKNCDLIKGGGGALTREKIVASMSQKVIIVVEQAKIKKQLGAFPLPVEVLQFGWRSAQEALKRLGATDVRLRLAGDKPFITDSGNRILDCDFTEIQDAEYLTQAINMIPSVTENGIFSKLCHWVLVGQIDGHVQKMMPQRQ